MAPDQKSLVAAGKLRKPAKWPLLANEGARDLLWGECQGSGANPYRTVLSVSDLGYKCSCPSRKFPCKHVLALGWQYAESPDRFADGTAPGWVDEWLSRRRPRSGAANPNQAKKPAGGSKSVSAADVAGRVEKVVTPEMLERRAKQAKARAEKRHEQILEGLDAYDRWAADMMRQGAASALPNLSVSCRTVAKRLVDAKAGTFAGLVDSIASQVYSKPEAKRAEAALLIIGRLHLLAQAYRRLDSLPAGLAQDVRRLIGWSVKRDELLADNEALRVAGTWSVIGGRSVVQDDDLRRVETWLCRNGEAKEGPGFAVLIDYHPVSVGTVASPFSLGDSFDATLVFYPSSMPLRAAIEERGATQSGGLVGLPASSIADFDSEFRERLALNPWLNDWPVIAHSCAFVESSGNNWLTDGSASVPMNPYQNLRSVRGFGLDPIVGLWNGERFTVLAANTALGWWEPNA